MKAYYLLDYNIHYSCLVAQWRSGNASVRRWTCDQLVVSSITAGTKLRNNLGQVFTPMCLYHQQYNLVLVEGR